MKQKNLYLMCGVPASGKSTLARKKFGDNPKAKIVSRDAIRFNILDNHPNANYFDYEKEVFNEFIKEINNSLRAPEYENVVADATHITVKSRAKVLHKIENLENINVIFCVTMPPLTECIARNAQRAGRERVPESAIVNMYNSFTLPSGTEVDNILRR